MALTICQDSQALQLFQLVQSHSPAVTRDGAATRRSADRRRCIFWQARGFFLRSGAPPAASGAGRSWPRMTSVFVESLDLTNDVSRIWGAIFALV